MTNLIKEAEEWLNAEEHEQLLAETGAGKPYTETIEKELIEKLTEALKRQQEVLEGEELIKQVQDAIWDATPGAGRCPQCTTNNKYYYLRAKAAIKAIKEKLNDN